MKILRFTVELILNDNVENTEAVRSETRKLLMATCALKTPPSQKTLSDAEYTKFVRQFAIVDYDVSPGVVDEPNKLDPCHVCGEPSDFRDGGGFWWCAKCGEGEECSNCDLDANHPGSCQFV